MKLRLILLSLFASVAIYAQDNLSALIPYPNSVELKKGTLNVSKKAVLSVNSDELHFASQQLQNIFEHRLGIKPTISDKGNINLVINPDIKGDEQYRLEVSTKGLLIEGKTPAGVLYGVCTLDQLLLGDVVNSKQGKIQSVVIDDTPAYPFRALMLDPARHFIPAKDVKFFIDQMVKFKYNALQLHLSDDQGWRIEIKSHPKLTEVGAFRNPKGGPQGPDNGFYTQQEMKDIIAYAAERNIEIIPEVDIPGHTVALMVAYPELRCDFLKEESFVIGKTTNKMISAANPKVYELLDDVIREFSEIFPSKKVHLGGDESVIGKNWGVSPENLALMQSLGYTKPEQLMGYFFSKVFESVKNYGMNAILWCELDSIYYPANEYLLDYPKNVTLVTWRNALTPTCINLTGQAGNKLILAPGEYCYLDYPQYKNDLPEFLNWGMPTTTLEKSYSLDPTYQLPEEKRNHIIGVMGTLWGEAIRDVNRVNYMTWPRGLALAEAGWTLMENRGWDSFRVRLYPNVLDLIKSGVSVRAPFEIKF